MSDDLDAFFNDPLIQSEVVWDNQSTFGIFDKASKIIAEGQVASKHYVLLMKTRDFDSSGEAKSGDSIEVDGDDYVVNTFSTLDDGELCQLELSKV